MRALQLGLLESPHVSIVLSNTPRPRALLPILPTSSALQFEMCLRGTALRAGPIEVYYPIRLYIRWQGIHWL